MFRSKIRIIDTKLVENRHQPSIIFYVYAAPTGELVPAKLVAQADGDYKVEYSSRFTGRHTVEILNNGQAIMGSPFFVEIYDPNKIRVEGMKTGMVNERMEFHSQSFCSFLLPTSQIWSRVVPVAGAVSKFNGIQ